VLYAAMFNWSSLFRSRWAALLWAGGICWSAVRFVPSEPAPEIQANAFTTDADDAAQIQHLQGLVAKLEH